MRKGEKNSQNNRKPNSPEYSGCTQPECHWSYGVREYQTINDYNICCFFNEIRKSYPDYHQKIHLIVDGAGYNKAHLVKDWAYVSNIELHYLPPYSPNLNPIERLWKVMNEHVRNNRYFADKHEFRDKVFKFFTTTLPDIADSLTSRINDHFQVLKTAS
ncbi:IS630 family transposase [Photorhabdus tasmaniensis]